LPEKILNKQYNEKIERIKNAMININNEISQANLLLSIIKDPQEITKKQEKYCFTNLQFYKSEQKETLF
jgi:thymidylate synthase